MPSVPNGVDTTDIPVGLFFCYSSD